MRNYVIDIQKLLLFYGLCSNCKPLGMTCGKSVTVVASTRFDLRFVVASSRCRVSAFTCALASERVIAKCMLLVMTSHCLLLLHHLSLCQPKFVLFGFWITNRQHHYFYFFVLHLNRRRKGHHSSLKLCSSNVKYFCFVVVRQLFLFIRIFLVVIHL